MDFLDLKPTFREFRRYLFDKMHFEKYNLQPISTKS